MYEGFAYWIDDSTLTKIRAIVVFAHTITSYKISLVFNGSGTSQNLPGILTAGRPIGDADNRIEP